MASGTYEQLFLLEVLVDEVRILSGAIEQYAPEPGDEPETPYRIRVKFGKFSCFEISQELAPPDAPKQFPNSAIVPIAFNSGRSCMFPMDPQTLFETLAKSPLVVTVYKKTLDIPFPIVVGQTKIPLTHSMRRMVLTASKWKIDEPLTEMVRGILPLHNTQDQSIGSIELLIRLTCLGNSVMTKFQIAQGKKEFKFKNAKKTDTEFRCTTCLTGTPIIRPRRFNDDAGGDSDQDDFFQVEKIKKRSSVKKTVEKKDVEKKIEKCEEKKRKKKVKAKEKKEGKGDEKKRTKCEEKPKIKKKKIKKVDSDEDTKATNKE